MAMYVRILRSLKSLSKTLFCWSRNSAKNNRQGLKIENYVRWGGLSLFPDFVNFPQFAIKVGECGRALKIKLETL